MKLPPIISQAAKLTTLITSLSSPAGAQELTPQEVIDNRLANTGHACAAFEINSNGTTNINRSTIVDFYNRLTTNRVREISTGNAEKSTWLDERMRELFSTLTYRYPEDLRQFQTDFKLKVDGVLGQQTIHAAETTVESLAGCILTNQFNFNLKDFQSRVTQLENGLQHLIAILNNQSSTNQSESPIRRVIELIREADEAKEALETYRYELARQPLSIENERLHQIITAQLPRILRLEHQLRQLEIEANDAPSRNSSEVIRG